MGVKFFERDIMSVSNLVHQEHYNGGLIRLTQHGNKFNVIYYQASGLMQSWQFPFYYPALCKARSIKKSFFVKSVYQTEERNLFNEINS